MDDYKDFVAPPPIWPKVLFGAVFAASVAVALITYYAERQATGHGSQQKTGTGVEQASETSGMTPASTGKRGPVRSTGIAASVDALAVSAPYQHCPKHKRVGREWRELRTEIAHWRLDGWVISCSYWGQELMTRDEVRL